MSLCLLLPEDGMSELLLKWPEEPRVYERGSTALDETITADHLMDYAFTGCVPADEIAVVKAPNPTLNQRAFLDNSGRSDPVKLRKLHGQGYTTRLGNLQRIIPFPTRCLRGLWRIRTSVESVFQVPLRAPCSATNCIRPGWPAYLDKLDLDGLALIVHQAAVAEVEYTT